MMITGTNVTLRGLELRDVDELFNWWNSMQFMGYSGRKADYINGKYLDDLMMDFLVEEWKSY
jgi:RimJ/RimL family protein N-acetyltransferase